VRSNNGDLNGDDDNDDDKCALLRRFLTTSI